MLLPLLGGGAQLLTPQVRAWSRAPNPNPNPNPNPDPSPNPNPNPSPNPSQVLDKLLPLACDGQLGPAPSPADCLEPNAATPATPAAAAPAAAAAPLAVQGAALQALQNATSDPRLTASLVGPDGAPTAGAAGEAVHALRDACALPHPALADVAFGAVANLQQLHYAAHCRDTTGAGARRAEVPEAHQRLPPPPPLPAASVAGRSHRAIPRLCQQLQPWASRAAQRRAALQLGGVLGAASLDDEAALALLRACDGVSALLRLLRGGAPPPAGAARVLTPPAPADVMEPLLRDACLHGLTLVARLGGALRVGLRHRVRARVGVRVSVRGP